MTLANIFVFVLAWLAVDSVALAWIIYATRQESKTTRSSVAQLRHAYATFGSKLATVEKQSPTKLAVEVADLADAVSRLRAMQQRFQGRFDQKMGRARTEEIDDDEYNAMLALQRASSGGGNGSP